MFDNYSILKVNNQDVLYLYLNPVYEFANSLPYLEKQRTIYENVMNFIENNKIAFQGKKVYLVVNGIIVSSLTLNEFPNNGNQSVDTMIPAYQYVEIINQLLPENTEIELLEEDSPINAGKLIDIKRSNGILEQFLLEEYVEGAVSAEMPIGFLKEARKALAVLARSYALQQEKTNLEIRDYNTMFLFKDKKAQKELWRENYEKQIEEITKAVKETQGEYLTYKGRIILPYTHIANNGKTEDAKDFLYQPIDYLKSIPSPWDRKELTFSSTSFLSYEELSNLLKQPLDETSTYKITEFSRGGRIKQIQLGKYLYRGDYLMKKLQLFGNDFTILPDQKGITFTFHSIGDGLGMSLYGANGMAKEGYNYREILSYYFPKTEIKKIS